MTISEIRTYVKQQYPLSKKWHKKVDKMLVDQVLAIYFRMIGASSRSALFISHPYEDTEVYVGQGPKHTRYCCLACGRCYDRDNPELTECEFCGSKDIERMYMAS